MLGDTNGSHLWPTSKTKGQFETHDRAWGVEGRLHLVEVVVLIDQLLQLTLYWEYSFYGELELDQRHSCFFEVFQEAYF